MQEKRTGYGASMGESLRGFWQSEMASTPYFRTLLALLWCVDIGLILIHILFIVGVLELRIFSIENDQGYAEFYQAIKEGWLTLIFFFYAVQSTNRRYLTWSAIFFYVLLDDFLMGHELVGQFLVRTFDIPDLFGFRGQDLGELMVFAIAGAILIPFLVIAFLRGDQTFRRDTLFFIGGFIIYACFAIGVDLLHILFWNTSLWDVFGMLEDAGELLVMTLMLWYGFLMLARKSLLPATS